LINPDTNRGKTDLVISVRKEIQGFFLLKKKEATMPVNIEKTNKKTGETVNKTYETVAERLRRFRARCDIAQGWGLITEVSFPYEKVVLCTARIVDPNGVTVATGTAEEQRDASYINKTSAVENAETSAVGRALMAAGYGNGEYASADELENAIKQQAAIQALEKAQGDTSGKKTGNVVDIDSRPRSAGASKGEATVSVDLEKYGMTPLPGVSYRMDGNTLVAFGKTYGSGPKLTKQGFKWVAAKKEWHKPVQ
jgi:hypothetical protein